MNTNIEALEKMFAQRHSHYALAPEWVAPQSEVESFLAKVLGNVPSAFNSQPVRMVLLQGENHLRHWQMIEDALQRIMGVEAYNQSTRDKIHGAFRAGVATILFFDDTTITPNLQEQFPLYAHNFPKWAEQTQGSHQFAVWLGLSEMGFGVSLQHYNGIIDEEIKREWGIPESWSLVGQMPFGKPLSQPEAKDKLPLETTLLIK